MSKNNAQQGQRSHMQQVTYVPRKASMLLLCLTRAKPKEIIKAVIQKGASHTASNCIFFSLFNQTNFSEYFLELRTPKVPAPGGRSSRTPYKFSQFQLPGKSLYQWYSVCLAWMRLSLIPSITRKKKKEYSLINSRKQAYLVLLCKSITNQA